MRRSLAIVIVHRRIARQRQDDSKVNYRLTLQTCKRVRLSTFIILTNRR